MKTSHYLIRCIYLLPLYWSPTWTARPPTLTPYASFARKYPIVVYKRYKRADIESNPRSDPNLYTNSLDTFSFLYPMIDSLTDGIVHREASVPSGYIDSNGHIDVGPKVIKNDWYQYMVQQTTIRSIVLVLFLLFLVILLLSILYCVFCTRCRRMCSGGSAARICSMIMLSILILFIIFGAVIALLSAWDLLKTFDKALGPLHDCNTVESNNSSPGQGQGDLVNEMMEGLNHIYVENYLQFEKKMQKILEKEPNATMDYIEHEAKLKSVWKLSKLVEKMPKVKELFEQLMKLMPDLRFLAIQLRDALRGVKRTLMLALMSQCTVSACQDFYKQNDIGSLDMGCLHYDSLPNHTEIPELLQKFIDSDSMKYPEFVNDQLRLIREALAKHLNSFLKPALKEIHNGGDELRKKLDLAKVVLEKAASDMRPANPSKNQEVLTSFVKMRSRIFAWYWHRITVFFIALILWALLLLIIGMIVSYGSPTIGAIIIYIAILFMFVAFLASILLAIFYIVLGGLMYHAACNRKYGNTLPNILINPNRYLPVAIARSKPLPVLRLYDALKLCYKKQSLFKVLELDKLFDLDGLRQKILGTLGKTEPLDLSGIKLYDESAKIVKKLLEECGLGNFSVEEYKKIICVELVPKSIKLPTLATDLDSLANSIGDPADKSLVPTLKNQATNLRSFSKNLEEPLLQLVMKIHKILDEIDEILTNKTGNLSTYLATLLEDIKFSEDYLKTKAESVTSAVIANITNYVDVGMKDYMAMVANVTDSEFNSCEELQVANQVDLAQIDLCKRVAAPMNGIWIGLLLSAFLFLPAICLAHILRCSLRRHNRSEESMDHLRENIVYVHNVMPIPTPWTHCHCDDYRYRNYYQYRVNVSSPDSNEIEQLLSELGYGTDIKPKTD